MKSHWSKLLLAFCLTISAVGLTSSAEAWYRTWRHHGYGYYHHYPYYRGGYGYGYHCRWVGGFWRGGYWHPARRVCWRR